MGVRIPLSAEYSIRDHFLNKKNTKIAWLPKNVFMLGMVSFFTDLSSEMIYPLLPLFLSSTLGASFAFIGLIEGIADSTASFFRVFSGYISDKVKKRKALIFTGYALSGLVKPLFSFAGNAFHVLFVRFADRLGKGIRTAPRDALIADSIDEKKRGLAFGFHRAMDTLGAVFGPLAAFLLLAWLPYKDLGEKFRAIFLVSLIPGIFAMIIIFFFVKEKIGKYKKELFKINFKKINPEFKMFIILAAIFTLGNSSDAFLILQAKKIMIPRDSVSLLDLVKFIPLIWLAFNVVYTIAATPVGILSDKIGRKKTIILGLVIYTLVYAGFAFARLSIHIWILFMVYGIHKAIIETNFRAYVADLVPSSFRATSYGIFHTVTGVIEFPSSIIMGFLLSAFGAPAFLFGSLLALVSAAGLIVFKTKK
ncbi:MAG: MFS transporter [Spirochaetes bacterium]|nr:MFS transporter [Spirochaetota bacterium]